MIATPTQLRRLAMTVTALLTIAIAPEADAVVYTMKRTAGGASIEKELGAKRVLDDSIIINGQKSRIRVSTVDMPLPTVLSRLAAFTTEALDVKSSHILIDGTDADGRPVRYLILSVGEKYHTVIFHLQLPENFKKERFNKSHWPKSVPFPTDPKETLVMNLDDRGTVFTSYKSIESPSVFKGRLTSKGWRAIDQSKDNSESQSVFLNKARNRLLVISSDTKGSVTHTTIVIKKVKK